MSQRSRAHPWFASDPHRIAQRQEEEREKLADFWDALPKIEWRELPAQPGPAVVKLELEARAVPCEFPKPKRPRARRRDMRIRQRQVERGLFALYCVFILVLVVGSCLGWWHVRGCG